MTKPDGFIKQAEEAGRNVRFLRFARERYSVRSFSDIPVEQHKVDSIMTAAQLAPTAVNYQPQMIYVLKTKRRWRRSVCLLPAGYASEDSAPYAPWHDVYRDISELTEEL